MSDFLGDLAARLDGAAPLLRPRLPALFETPDGGAGFSARPEHPVSGDVTFVTQDIEQEAPGAPPRRQNPPPAPPLSARTAPAEPRRESERRDPPFAPAQAATPPAAAPSRHQAPTIRQEAQPALPSNAPDVFRESELPAAKPARRRAQRNVAAEIEDDSAAAAPPLPAVSRRRGADTEQVPQAPLTPSAAVTPPLRQPAPLPRLTPAVPPFAPLPPSPRAAPQPRLEAQARPAPQAEQTIHVTIGRVDVRATGDAQSPRAARETSPVMSLDDYLRSRAK